MKCCHVPIDAGFVGCGWLVQSCDEMNLSAGPGVAVREFATGSGPLDYCLWTSGSAARWRPSPPDDPERISEQAARYIADAPNFLGAERRKRWLAVRGNSSW
jgi:type I restriction enzyme R subunit